MEHKQKNVFRSVGDGAGSRLKGSRCSP